MHLILHFSLGISSVAVYYYDVEKDQNNDDCDDHTSLNTIFFRKEIWGVSSKCRGAHGGRVSETSTDRIENCQALKLASVGAIINDQRRIDASSVGLPVADFLIYYVIGGSVAGPVRATERVLDASLSLLEVETESLMSELGALLIYYVIAILMYICHVFPPLLPCTQILVILLIETLFSKILQNDVTTLNVFV